ncbi:MAG: DUF3800 domain-containing protein [Verrucomicrobiota bacterium]
MELIYVDESGDIGTVNSPTAEYLLVAMIVPEESWHELDGRITQARQRMKAQLGLDMAAEIHAVEFLGGAKFHQGLETWQRLWVTRWLLRELSRQNGLRFAVIVRTKVLESEVLTTSWRALRDSVDHKIRGRAMLITDVTDRQSVLKAIGRHPAGNHPAKPKRESTFQAKLIEDPIHMDSRHSRILQMVDLVAYLWRQKLRPNSLFQKKGPRELIRLTIKLTGTAE